MMLYRFLSCLSFTAFCLLSLASVSPASVPTGFPTFEANGGFSVELEGASGWQEIVDPFFLPSLSSQPAGLA